MSNVYPLKEDQVKIQNLFRLKLAVSGFLAIGIFILSLFVFSQELRTIQHPKTLEELPLYPERLDVLPGIPSPYRTGNGMEIVVGITTDKKFILFPVTQRKGESWIPDQDLWGIGDQLHVDGEDFPTLARTGLHSEIELDRTKEITGRSTSEITESGRPEGSSTAGFMAADEDISSVLKGDNLLVKQMGMTHPQMAKPLFHVWNLILKIGHRQAENLTEEFEYFLYNGKKVIIASHRTKPAQFSLFNDGYRGGSDIDIWRELEKGEEEFLREKYRMLTEEEMGVLFAKISRMHTGELEPYYIMHYGFYEGHTDYRTDPVAIAFVFGLKSLEEIEAVFPGKLYDVLTDHFVREGQNRGNVK